MPPKLPRQVEPGPHNSSSSTESGNLAALPADHAPTGDTPEQGSDDAAAFARAIKAAGMEGPASIALRVVGPLGWIGGQMLWAVQPLLQGLGSGTRQSKSAAVCRDLGVIPRLAKFLEGEGNVAELARRLEADADGERKVGSKAEVEKHGPR